LFRAIQSVAQKPSKTKNHGNKVCRNVGLRPVQTSKQEMPAPPHRKKLTILPEYIIGMSHALLAILMIVRVVGSLSHQWSFVKQSHSKSAMILLEMKDMDTERACQVECGNNEMCKAISYASRTCILLGEENPEMVCSGVVTVATKQPKTVERTNRIEEMGSDRCARELFPDITILDGTEGVCPRDNHMLIIRGVHENGKRMTFDNDKGNVLRFYGERNMWSLEFVETGLKTWLVAVS
ncbi:hypothetical protein PMAYCL1PPCAC_32963, partial [Pristionchus mayeri]